MLFNSFLFVAFAAVVLPTAVVTAKHVRVRNVFLLCASYLFYACWDWRFLGLIWFSTAVDFACGRVLARKRSRLPVAISVIVNLGLLGVFKYYGFFVDNLIEVSHHFGIEMARPSLEIVLPVGISFYTFQTMSYTLDVYRGEIEPEHDIITFALFVAFFPQLVAGPIERAKRFLPQLRSPTAITLHGVRSGLWLCGAGLFKKVVIADNVSEIADAIFAASSPTGAEVLLGVLAFAVQIYCDFSGYSDVARGLARIMGFELVMNFDRPYFATSPSDFWRRWHISLSTWLRDYLYIPLGGNRGTRLATYRNLMLTMVLGGLWHGAAWNFVLWGCYHGVLLSLHRIVRSMWNSGSVMRSHGQRAVSAFVQIVVMWFLTGYGWLLFRAESGAQIREMTGALARGLFGFEFGGVRERISDTKTLGLALSLVLLFVVQFEQMRKRDDEFVLTLAAWWRAPIYAAAVLAFIYFGAFGGKNFIYFQF